MSEADLKRIAEFLYEISTMRRIPRMHRQALLTDDMSDNIATHLFRVAIIGYFLAKLEGVDWTKVVLMCLLHDSGESRTNDHNWIHKRHVTEDSEKVLAEQLGTLPFPELAELMREYEKRESREAIVAKDADVLDQVLLLREYVKQGNQEAQVWLDGKHEKRPYHQKHCKTESGKQLGEVLCETDPASWWEALYTNKRREQPHS